MMLEEATDCNDLPFTAGLLRAELAGLYPMKLLTAFILLLLAPGFVLSQNWVQVGLGAYPGGVYTLYADAPNNILYAGGNFKTAGTDTISGVAQWNGIQWDSLGAGVGNGARINAFAAYNGQLYAGGNFNRIGGVTTSSIARWNGITWDSLKGGLGSPVFSLHVFHNSLYIAGMFGYADTTISRSIVEWDGNAYHSAGDPTWTLVEVHSLQDYMGELYAAGSFDADDYNSKNILRWNEIGWSGVGNGICPNTGGYPTVKAMTVYNGELFIAGGFDINCNADNNIIRWNGNNFLPVGGGFNASVTGLVVYNNELYAVGYFTEAGGVPANCIAKWDGTNWCSLGSTFNGVIYCAEVFNNELYIGGNFTNIDGYNITGVAKWIGGSYVDTCGNMTAIKDVPNSCDLTVHPNPVNEELTISFTAPAKGEGKIAVMNTLGQRVYEHQLDKCIGKCSQKVNISELPRGVYFIQLAFADGTITRKFIKQ